MRAVLSSLGCVRVRVTQYLVWLRGHRWAHGQFGPGSHAQQTSEQGGARPPAPTGACICSRAPAECVELRDLRGERVVT